jgi:hypothetical protein
LGIRSEKNNLKYERSFQPPLFHYSSIPLFPPGRRPFGPEANWCEAPKLVSC